MKKTYRKAVFIVCYKKEESIKYLLLKRKLHWAGWEFPKGGIESRESLIQAVKREIKEETGQRAEKITKFKEAGKYEYDKEYEERKGTVGQTYTLFAAELKSRKIKIDKREHSEYNWSEYNKAEKILTWQDQKKCLEIVDNFLKREAAKK